MTEYHGSCSCGQLTIVAAGEPLRVGVCHCLACQLRTGSAFSVQARFGRDAVRMSGRASEYVRISDDGDPRTFYFCAGCGATVSYVCASEPEAIAIPVGAFADPTFPAPSRSVWEARMHPWVSLAGNGIRHRQ